MSVPYVQNSLHLTKLTEQMTLINYRVFVPLLHQTKEESN